MQASLGEASFPLNQKVSVSRAPFVVDQLLSIRNLFGFGRLLECMTAYGT